jgi:lysyl-tRNA synthetase class 2
MSPTDAMTEPDSTPNASSPPTADRFELERVKKLEAIQALGLDPWGTRFDNHIPIAKAREAAPAEHGIDGEQVRVAGRICFAITRESSSSSTSKTGADASS